MDLDAVARSGEREPVLFAAALVLVAYGKCLPSWLFDPLEWIWLFGALPALVGFVGSTYLVLAIAVHAGRALLAIRDAVRLCTRGSAGTSPR